jgi:C4-dicarboxylate-specific signal transduction histidine kinase
MELLRHKEEELQHYQRIQSIGQMSSHIAHEFNNYLTPIIV